MTDLKNYRINMLVTLPRITSSHDDHQLIMTITSFWQQNNGEWHARVYFECDPLKTTVSFPIAVLYPVNPIPQEALHAVTVH